MGASFLGRPGSGGHAVGRHRVELQAAGHAALLPAGPALADGHLLQGDGRLGAALELGQQAGAEGEGVGRPLAGLVVADGQVALPGVQRQAVLAGAAQDQRPGAARRVGQQGLAQHGPEAPGQRAGQLDQGVPRFR
jgi:hypothetical protein